MCLRPDHRTTSSQIPEPRARRLSTSGRAQKHASQRCGLHYRRHAEKHDPAGVARRRVRPDAVRRSVGRRPSVRPRAARGGARAALRAVARPRQTAAEAARDPVPARPLKLRRDEAQRRGPASAARRRGHPDRSPAAHTRSLRCPVVRNGHARPPRRAPGRPEEADRTRASGAETARTGPKRRSWRACTRT